MNRMWSAFAANARILVVAHLGAPFLEETSR